MSVSFESVRAAISFILEIWKLSEYQDDVLRMLGLPLSERPNGNADKYFTPCQLRVSVRGLEAQEAAGLGICLPAYEIVQKSSSVSYIIWQVSRQDTRGRSGIIPLAKRRDELEAEKKIQQIVLL